MTRDDTPPSRHFLMPPNSLGLPEILRTAKNQQEIAAQHWEPAFARWIMRQRNVRKLNRLYCTIRPPAPGSTAPQIQGWGDGHPLPPDMWGRWVEVIEMALGGRPTWERWMVVKRHLRQYWRQQYGDEQTFLNNARSEEKDDGI